MTDSQRTYIAIDLKSFYASVECIDHKLDPLNANLVVADSSRSDKTICLAVSPALKQFGVPGRPRLYQVEQTVDKINRQRQQAAPRHRLTTYSSFNRQHLLNSKSLKVLPAKLPYRQRDYLLLYHVYAEF